MNRSNTITDVITGSSLQPFINDTMVESDSGYLLIDKKGKPVLANSEFWELNKSFSNGSIFENDFSHPDFLRNYSIEFLRGLHEVLDGKKENVEIVLHTVYDSSINYYASISCIKNEIGFVEGAYIIFTKKEKEVYKVGTKKSDLFYKSILDNTADVFLLANEKFQFFYSTPSVKNILGFSDFEMVGLNALDRIHPDERENVKEWFDTIILNPGVPFTIEYRIKNKAGMWIWVENNARNLLQDKNLQGIFIQLRIIQAKKIADEAFIQSEQRLSLLLNNTDESFIILNSRLRIITYNRAAQEHSPFFFTSELQSGLSVLDLVNPEEVSNYIELFEQVFEGTEMEKETKYIDKMGRVRVFNHSFRPLFDSQNDIFGVFISSTDISVRRKLAEELDTHSERLKTAQQIARLGYFEYTFKNSNFFASDQFYEILGISDENLNWIDYSIVDKLVHPEDRLQTKVEFKNSIKFGIDFNFEFRIILPDETTKVILAIGGSEKGIDGKPEKFRVTLQDITDSKMALVAIQTLEGRFKSLFDNSLDGIILSKEEGEIISVNPAICKLLGYDRSEISNMKRWDILDLESHFVQEMFDVRGKTGEYIGELELRHKNGQNIAVEVSSIIIKDPENKNYISTIVRDITEKKKIESEQMALTQELLKNNQDLQQFSFITSHNLRAPVANLLSLLSLYNKQSPSDSFNQVLVEKFEEATMQLNQTLNDLVNVLVIKSNNNVERENIDLGVLFSDVNKNINNLLLEKQGIITTDFNEVESIFYNRINIESIFLNMISNAIRYSSPQRNPRIHISSYKEANWIVIQFSDNGLGLDLNRYSDRLFGLYQRFHVNKEGKGLGLYMTKSQVTAMGGKIEVESTPDVGTTFKIYIKS